MFRAQDLSGDDQVRLCRQFGPITLEAPGGYGYVSNANGQRFQTRLAFPEVISSPSRSGRAATHSAAIFCELGKLDTGCG